MDEQAVSLVMKQLDRIESKLDNVIRNGCSKAESHNDVEARLRTVEGWQQSATGRALGASTVISVAAGIISFAVGLWYKK